MTVKMKLFRALYSKFGTGTFTRGDILRTLIEDAQGNKGGYRPTEDRGYYATALCQHKRWRGYNPKFATKGNLVAPNTNCKVYLSSTKRNVWKLNNTEFL
jgi:hypothetical protein